MTSQEGALGRLVRKVEERLEAGDEVSIGLIQAVAGHRAAGPMLLLPALLVISPLSIIPGVPTLVGINTILVAGQIVLGRDQVWLPKWLTERCISAKHARTLMKFLVPASRMADGVVKRRARFMTGMVMRRIGAAICVLVGAIMPLLEFVPFTSTGAAGIIAVYALSITARDGWLALAWMGLVAGAVGLGWLLLG
ncbi:exopolysaccharide biosynthesis protein [Devosia sp. YIM 151766]|uniref:exopolysaccharide biosynthesis protein n=1 Tax=Devosia sp. YIM 151766 TaxID=3017325 RepID=UPI00255C5BAE|nr:exopolysaccharide biosynthesis protein [Devosia sp. YIM 151766]WIY52345.1 exopolysaccharide biosynthesis protein [Devosia sp. YIM 151766]